MVPLLAAGATLLDVSVLTSLFVVPALSLFESFVSLAAGASAPLAPSEAVPPSGFVGFASTGCPSPLGGSR